MPQAGFQQRCGPQDRPDNLAAPQRWTLMSETLRELRRSWHAHRGRQMTLEAIACLIAGFTARSGALAITSYDHTATRFRLTSKSRITPTMHGLYLLDNII
jgi:hypothetical protein